MPSDQEDQAMNALTFHDTPITIIDRGGTPWMPGPEIGAALGYEHPGEQIAKVYARNKGEFSEEMTRTAKMAGRDGRMNTIRVFSPRGALLLAMHANTERAVAFRAWVLDILEGKTPLPGRADRLSQITEALLVARPRWERHLFYASKELTHSEIARIEGISTSAVTLDARELRRLGLLHRVAKGPRGAGLIAQERRAGLFAGMEEGTS